MHKFWLSTALALAALTSAGCERPPQMARQNQKLIDGLRTATSSRQLPWVDECSKLLDERKQQHQIAPEEIAALEEIIALARAGKWKEAEAQTIRLGKAQNLAE